MGGVGGGMAEGGRADGKGMGSGAATAGVVTAKGSEDMLGDLIKQLIFSQRLLTYPCTGSEETYFETNGEKAELDQMACSSSRGRGGGGMYTKCCASISSWMPVQKFWNSLSTMLSTDLPKVWTGFSIPITQASLTAAKE